MWQSLLPAEASPQPATQWEPAGWILLPHCVLSQCCVLSIQPAEHSGNESTDLFFFLDGTKCTGKYKKAKREQSCFVPFNLRFGGLWSLKHTLEISKSCTISSFVVLKDLQQPSAGESPWFSFGVSNVESIRKARSSPLGMACRAKRGVGWGYRVTNHMVPTWVFISSEQSSYWRLRKVISWEGHLISSLSCTLYQSS